MTEHPHKRTECHECGARIHTLGFRCDGCERKLRERIRADIERDECRDCGQAVLGERDPSGAFQCYHCAETPRTAPPVTALRLFEPAPQQMPGQTWIETP